MDALVLGNLKKLHEEKKLNKPIILWGIGNQTAELIQTIRELDNSLHIEMIVDNFKCAFQKEFMGIPVAPAYILKQYEKDSVVVLLCVNYADSIHKQLVAYDMKEVYNLRKLEETLVQERIEIPYQFINRQKGCKTLCYILAGYEPTIWDGTLARIEAYQSDQVDYCLVSSGKYDEYLAKMAERNQWSYLYTEHNQVCFVQNQVVELHPSAEYIIKMDEDIFIGKDFFRQMMSEFELAEKEGEYRIGFAVPCIPLNCTGYVSYLKAIDKLADFEARFGRAYRSRFSAVFSVEDTAEYLWETMNTFDSMADRFSEFSGYEICDCYFNIGCIMFTRERWLMMGKWPVEKNSSGMGLDEMYIYQDNVEKDMSIYEFKGVLAGHLAFGHQKRRMLEYYQQNKEKFIIQY